MLLIPPIWCKMHIGGPPVKLVGFSRNWVVCKERGDKSLMVEFFNSSKEIV